MPEYRRLRLWWIRETAMQTKERFVTRRCTAEVYPCPVCGRVVPPTVPVCFGPHEGLTAQHMRKLGVLE